MFKKIWTVYTYVQSIIQVHVNPARLHSRDWETITGECESHQRSQGPLDGQRTSELGGASCNKYWGMDTITGTEV